MFVEKEKVNFSNRDEFYVAFENNFRLEGWQHRTERFQKLFGVGIGKRKENDWRNQWDHLQVQEIINGAKERKRKVISTSPELKESYLQLVGEERRFSSG